MHTCAGTLQSRTVCLHVTRQQGLMLWQIHCRVKRRQGTTSFHITTNQNDKLDSLYTTLFLLQGTVITVEFCSKFIQGLGSQCNLAIIYIDSHDCEVVRAYTSRNNKSRGHTYYFVRETCMWADLRKGTVLHTM